MSKPSLPQAPAPAEEREARAFQLSLARTAYNYTRSYPHLDTVPLSARLPPGEAFSLDYNLKLANVLTPLSENFLAAVAWVLEREFDSDYSQTDIERIAEAFKSLKKLAWDHPIRDKEVMDAFVDKISKRLPDLLSRLSNLPSDVQRMLTGFEATLREAAEEGPTAFLKTMLHAMVATDGTRDFLKATSTADFESLFQTLPKPAMLTQARQPWMPKAGKPCEQDWFFGYLQVAGFNTTNLCGVSPEAPAAKGISLSDLRKKLPDNMDDVLRSVLGDSTVSLQSAAQAGKLYVCDYVALADARGSKVHDEERYVTAPIALFYWNDARNGIPTGYPPHGYGDMPGFLQPIAIQLAQRPDPETAPLFTPNDCAGGNDPALLKWQLAKLFVNAACATQHESVAHLGDCHLVMSAIAVATHRQLAEQHPLYKLLWPHLRFTLSINDGAMHNLVIPGGVVATNVGTAISTTLDLINAARASYSWDEQNPERNFEKRGVAGRFVFPFRDDTLQVWNAIKTFVRGYLDHTYKDMLSLEADLELQAWINELVSPQCANISGVGGLVWAKDKQSCKITNLERLTEIVAQIIYTAGPKHAAVNYPQYPLGAYAPSVAASVYSPPPARSQELSVPAACLPWFLPLDIALYALSFEYLLSGMQYDKLGHYETDSRTPYFEDEAVRDLVAEFQAELATIETKIRKLNTKRPMPYPYQLPSQIPNSISI